MGLPLPPPTVHRRSRVSAPSSATLAWGPSTSIELDGIHLVTLRADFPDTHRSLPSDACAPDCLSWGFPKMPSVVSDRGVHSRLRSVAAPGLRIEAASLDRVPSSWFPTTSAASSSVAAPVCCTRLPTLGFAAFRPAAMPESPRRVPALQSFVPLVQRRSGSRLLDSTDRGFASPSPRRCRRALFTASLAPSPSAPAVTFITTRRPTSRPCSTRGAGILDLVSEAAKSLLSWA